MGIRHYKQKGEDCFDLKAMVIKQKNTLISLLAKQVVSIGRSQTSDIVFNYPGVENHHAKIIIRNKKLYVVKVQG